MLVLLSCVPGVFCACSCVLVTRRLGCDGSSMAAQGSAARKAKGYLAARGKCMLIARIQCLLSGAVVQQYPVGVWFVGVVSAVKALA